MENLSKIYQRQEVLCWFGSKETSDTVVLTVLGFQLQALNSMCVI